MMPFRIFDYLRPSCVARNFKENVSLKRWDYSKPLYKLQVSIYQKFGSITCLVCSSVSRWKAWLLAYFWAWNQKYAVTSLRGICYQLSWMGVYFSAGPSMDLVSHPSHLQAWGFFDLMRVEGRDQLWIWSVVRIRPHSGGHWAEVCGGGERASNCTAQDISDKESSCKYGCFRTCLRIC